MNRLLHLNYDPERSPASPEAGASRLGGALRDARWRPAARLPAGARPRPAPAGRLSLARSAPPFGRLLHRAPAADPRPAGGRGDLLRLGAAAGRVQRRAAGDGRRLGRRPPARRCRARRRASAPTGSTSWSSSPATPATAGCSPARAARRRSRSATSAIPTPPASPAIDYRITDHLADPDGFDEHYCETPDPAAALLSRLCDAAPRAGDRPAARCSATATSPSARSTTWPRSIAA